MLVILSTGIKYLVFPLTEKEIEQNKAKQNSRETEENNWEERRAQIEKKKMRKIGAKMAIEISFVAYSVGVPSVKWCFMQMLPHNCLFGTWKKNNWRKFMVISLLLSMCSRHTFVATTKTLCKNGNCARKRLVWNQQENKSFPSDIEQNPICFFFASLLPSFHDNFSIFLCPSPARTYFFRLTDSFSRIAA